MIYFSPLIYCDKLVGIAMLLEKQTLFTLVWYIIIGDASHDLREEHVTPRIDGTNGADGNSVSAASCLGTCTDFT